MVFDEHVFPFSTKHPNAGARLRAEISLLPETLLNSSTQFGDANLLDPHVRNTSPDGDITRSGRVFPITAEISEENGSDWCTSIYHRMCPPAGGSADLEE